MPIAHRAPISVSSCACQCRRTQPIRSAAAIAAEQRAVQGIETEVHGGPHAAEHRMRNAAGEERRCA